MAARGQVDKELVVLIPRCDSLISQVKSDVRPTVDECVKPDGSGPSITKSVDMDPRTLAKQICDQLTKLQPTKDYLVPKTGNLSESTLQLLNELTLDKISFDSDDAPIGQVPNVPDFDNFELFNDEPDDVLDLVDTNTVPMAELLRSLVCEHRHKDEDVESSFKKIQAMTEVRATDDDRALKTLVNELTRTKEFCWLADSKLKWTSYMKSPLDVMKMFKQCCDIIEYKCRMHGAKHNDETLNSLKAKTEGIVAKCSYLTANKPKEGPKSGLRNIVSLHRIFSKNIDACTNEYNKRRSRFFKDPETGSDPIPLGSFSRPMMPKLMVAIRNHEWKNMDLHPEEKKLLEEKEKEFDVIKDAQTTEEKIATKEEATTRRVEEKLKECVTRNSIESSFDDQLNLLRRKKETLEAELNELKDQQMEPISRSRASSGSSRSSSSKGSSESIGQRLRPRKGQEESSGVARMTRSKGSASIPSTSSRDSSPKPSTSKGYPLRSSSRINPEKKKPENPSGSEVEAESSVDMDWNDASFVKFATKEEYLERKSAVDQTIEHFETELLKLKVAQSEKRTMIDVETEKRREELEMQSAIAESIQVAAAMISKLNRNSSATESLDDDESITLE